MQTVREGTVTITVPPRGDSETDRAVFYNPTQELNRDITIAALRAYRERNPAVTTYLDAMTATGIRGIRATADGWEVTCLDLDPEAVELCQENLAANDLAATVAHRDAAVELHEQWYDVVDIDPFGTPIPYVDPAFKRTRHLVCITATDTAPLCGAHFNSGIRRYGAVPRNTEYHGEMGVRILLSALARTAARYDVGITPVLTHATRHYVRTYLTLTRTATAADATIDELGYIHHCWECRTRTVEDGLIAHPPETCPSCGSDHVDAAGPVWLAPVHDRAFVDRAKHSLTPDMGTHETATALLETLHAELDTPTHYDQHRLCRLWSRSASAMDDFLAAIRAAGYPASRTHYGGTTFKTTADLETIKTITA